MRLGLNSCSAGRDEIVARDELVHQCLPRAAVLCGEHGHPNAVVIKFLDQPTLQGWYASPAYQDLIPIRDQAADVVLISYDA